MKKEALKILKVVFGLFIFAVGTVMTINANIGYGPWDVLNSGINNTFGITMGRSNILIGLLLLTVNTLLGQGIGIATVFNMLLIGTFMDILMLNNLIPTFTGLVPRAIMLFSGIFVLAIASWIYISVGLGAGPRDGIMVALTNKTGKPVGVIKSGLEIGAVLIGYMLGGQFGIGTIIMAFAGGPIFQLVFKMVNFDIKSVKHRFIQDDIKYLKEKIAAAKE